MPRQWQIGPSQAWTRVLADLSPNTHYAELRLELYILLCVELMLVELGFDALHSPFPIQDPGSRSLLLLGHFELEGLAKVGKF